MKLVLSVTLLPYIITKSILPSKFASVKPTASTLNNTGIV